MVLPENGTNHHAPHAASQHVITRTDYEGDEDGEDEDEEQRSLLKDHQKQQQQQQQQQQNNQDDSEEVGKQIKSRKNWVAFIFRARFFEASFYPVFFYFSFVIFFPVGIFSTYFPDN